MRHCAVLVGVTARMVSKLRYDIHLNSARAAIRGLTDPLQKPQFMVYTSLYLWHRSNDLTSGLTASQMTNVKFHVCDVCVKVIPE